MAEDKIDDLIRQLASRDSDMRENAAYALGKIAEKNPNSPELVSAVPALIEALKDEHAKVRFDSAYILGLIGDVRAVHGLVDALKDEDADVWRVAAWALEKIIPSLTDIHLGEIGKGERVVREILEKAEGREKDVLLEIYQKLNIRRNEILEPEAKKLKPPKILKRKKPKRRMWRIPVG